LLALRNYGANRRDLSATLKHVSSGLRVEKAADDPAGAAVAENLDTTGRSAKQAARNILDGISTVEMAEAATAEVHNIWKRLRELAVQSASETLNSTERSYVNTEAQALISESQRIARTTEFNGIKLLSDTAQVSTSSMGAQWKFDETTGSTASDSVSGDDLTLNSFPGDNSQWVAGRDGNALEFDGSDDYLTSAVSGGGGDIDAAAAFTMSVWIKPDSVGGDRENIYSTSVNQLRTDVDNGAGDTAGDQMELRLKDSSDTELILTDPSTTNLNQDEWNHIVATYDGSTAKLFVNGTEVASDTGTLSGALKDSAWAPRVGAYSAGSSEYDGSMDDFRVYSTALNGVDVQAINESNESSASNVALNVQVGINNSTHDRIAVDYGNLMNVGLWSQTGGSDPIQLDTVANAQSALPQIDKVLDVLSRYRSSYGAVTNRLESALSNLEVSQNNNAAALSQIRDADLAYETAQLARQQLIDLAGLSVLAQASRINDGVLRLLN